LKKKSLWFFCVLLTAHFLERLTKPELELSLLNLEHGCGRI
jgi:hypothetical protein